jgi:hypothetical protein
VLSGSDALVDLLAQLERLSACAARAAARFDTDGQWALAGARSPAMWLAVERRIPKPQARRLLRLGRAARQMPAVQTAWLDGSVSAAHVSLLSTARAACSEAFERDEQILVAEAARLRFDQFDRVITYWRQLNDPDDDERRANRAETDRAVHLSPTLDGIRVLKGTMSPIGGAILDTELRRLEQQLFEADRAEAKARVGDGFTLADLRRTPAQRRHDALVEMARRSAAMAPGARRPDPLFTVLIDRDTLSQVARRFCETADGTVVSPTSLVPWFSDAWLERVLHDSDNRVINLGVHRRVFTGATRRAVELRDLECYHPYCDTRYHHCQIDHIQPYATGGPTTDTNGRCACGYHNRLRHQHPPARRPTEPPH